MGYFDYQWGDRKGAKLESDTPQEGSRVCGTGENLAFQL